MTAFGMCSDPPAHDNAHQQVIRNWDSTLHVRKKNNIKK